VRDLVGPGVEAFVVERLVDPHAPEHDRGVVAVADHHGLDATAGQVLPGAVADVLPSGHLLKHEQPHRSIKNKAPT
jgi:hypothetical protein